MLGICCSCFIKRIELQADSGHAECARQQSAILWRIMSFQVKNVLPLEKKNKLGRLFVLVVVGYRKTKRKCTRQVSNCNGRLQLCVSFDNLYTSPVLSFDLCTSRVSHTDNLFGCLFLANDDDDKNKKNLKLGRRKSREQQSSAVTNPLLFCFVFKQPPNVGHIESTNPQK